MNIPSTADLYSPHDLLPAPEPSTIEPDEHYFYDHVSKFLIKDVVRVMANGIPINLDKVRKLEAYLDVVLKDVDKTIQANQIIQEFQEQTYEYNKADYVEEQTTKCKTSADFIKPFDTTNLVHRSYFMNELITSGQLTLPVPTDLLPTGIPKWTVNQIKAHIEVHPVLRLLIAKEIRPEHRAARAAMLTYAEHKAAIHNRQYEQNIEDLVKVKFPRFKVSSSIQKRRLFDFLGIESETTSKKTGEDSWSRDEVERVNKETGDDDIRTMTQAFIDYSFGAVVKQNFIAAFYKYTIDNRLYGSLKLFGAKTFRLTSQNPNLLNMPSTKSIYSKPIKRCFIAPPGYVVLTADFSALEDRVIASLSRDKNKCAVFLDGLDGHCLNAYGYFKEEIAQHMTLTGDVVVDVKEFFRLVEEGHKALKAIRQKGKPATFGLNYGSYPPKVSKSLKIDLESATKIFNSYHNELYGGITKYRENYILPTAKSNGRIHLGLGCYIYSDNPRRDIRTLHNASCQFWSILTLLTINKMHQLIDLNGMSDDIFCISSIYDSIYFIVKEDPTTIKWLNDNLIPVMTKDFMVDQTIPNDAVAEIGYSWSVLHHLSNGASLDEVTATLQFASIINNFIRLGVDDDLVDSFLEKGIDYTIEELQQLTTIDSVTSFLVAHIPKKK